MTGVEVAFGAVAVAAGLFKFCVDGLEVISKAKDSPKQVLHFSARLDLEVARLILWGRNAGIADGTLVRSLRPIDQHLVVILSALSSSIQDADRLRYEYGIRLSEDSEVQSVVDLDVDDNEHQALQAVDFLAVPDAVAKQDRERSRSLLSRIMLQTSIFHRTKWAVSDGAKAMRFLDEIRGYVDGLNQLLAESRLYIPPPSPMPTPTPSVAPSVSVSDDAEELPKLPSYGRRLLQSPRSPQSPQRRPSPSPRRRSPSPPGRPGSRLLQDPRFRAEEHGVSAYRDYAEREDRFSSTQAPARYPSSDPGDGYSSRVPRNPRVHEQYEEVTIRVWRD